MFKNGSTHVRSGWSKNLEKWLETEICRDFLRWRFMRVDWNSLETGEPLRLHEII